MTLLDPIPLAPATAFWDGLAAFGDATALHTEDGSVTYADLAARVDDLAARLGPTRRLVALRARNDIATVVGYLACLRGRHPVLVTADDRLDAAYDPDVVLDGALRERRRGTAHDLHPDLAVLLSTSGSTGSPKLVRLGAAGVAANAVAIGEALGIRATDVAATTLPLHYCYGLSVLTSHLAVGASLLLTDRSVVDPALWTQARRAGVTTFPGVPHTFDLLDRAGLPDLPSLRYVTQAGGRLAPATVRRYAELGQRRGFDLVVMYGATEATARMTVLPPDLALTHPQAVGYAVPGGSVRLDGPVDGVGELVYRGENVMLGYAETPVDLSRGRDVVELRTGDLARIGPDGLVELTGRRARLAKVFGLRVDLDRVELALLDAGVVAHAVDGGDRVVVGVDVSAAPLEEEPVRAALGELGLPAAGVSVVGLSEVPRTPSGKPDLPAIAALARRTGAAAEEADVAGVFRTVLGGEVGPDDTFVGLGGDSLSYVEASLRLEKLLGRLPVGWHRLTVRELSGGPEPSAEPRRPRLGRTVETNVLLRAAAIVAIVGSHSNLFMVMGGAHVLVGLAGFNFGRFQLTDHPRVERTRRLAASILRIVVPSVLWLTFAAAASAKYGVLNVLLLNGLLGSRDWTESWHYWFVEALVWTLVALTALLAVPAVDRLERRHPFGLPFGLALLFLLTRYDVVRLFHGPDVDYIHRAHVIFWLFALGWATVKARRTLHRLAVSTVVVLTVPGFFEGAQHGREAVIVVGMLMLVWLPTVRVPQPVARLAGVLASASLYIYLCHWQIYPYYEFKLPWLATTLSLSAGVLLWWGVSRVSPTVERTAGRLLGEISHNRRWLKPRRSARDVCIAPAGATH